MPRIRFLFYKKVSHASSNRPTLKLQQILVLKLSWDFIKSWALFSVDGEEGNNIQDWKYAHFYICAIALEWFSHSQSQSYHEWTYYTGEKCSFNLEFVLNILYFFELVLKLS